MRLKNQDEILDAGIRKKIIEEIHGTENKERKNKHFKRHMLLKDQSEYYVLDLLSRQFDQSTVREMFFAVSNISIYKKVIDKLARVYNFGCDRKAVNESGKEVEASTKSIQQLSKLLQINTKQKQANRILKAHKNAAMYLKPCPDEDGKYSVVAMPLAPYLYDVVEDYYDRTKPMVYILSNYDMNQVTYTNLDPSKEGRSFDQSVKPSLGNGKDEVIADSPEDAALENKEFIWWSDKYHFTTNGKGEIISESTDNPHPLKKKPFVDYGIDRDNSFWAMGGDDLAESSVRLNAQVSHINYIGQLQGYGLFYYSGKNPPNNMSIGPNKGIVLQYEEGDPQPQIGFASASPQLTSLQAQVEMQVAMLLTTNNLSTSGVATSLNTSSPSSGIALIIDKSESMEDVNEQQQLFIDKEPEMWDIINGWLQLYGSESSLDDSLVGLQIPETDTVVVSFPGQQVIMTEKEKLDNIQLRKDLGLNTMAELVRIDQPGLNDEEAKAKLKKIADEKKARMEESAKVIQSNGNNQENSLDESQDDDSEQEQADLGTGPIQ